MTHEERFIFSEVNFPSDRYSVSEGYCEEHIRIPEFELALYADLCEQATMPIRSIACMLFRFKR